MAQSLLFGLGGTGSRIVNKVAKELHKNGKEINNGEICCAVLDTDGNDMQTIAGSGTNIPIIATSTQQTVGSYLNKYNNRGIKDWCPLDSAFQSQTISQGASAYRVKSRVALMDCIESGELERELRPLINMMRSKNPETKLRIMIVSSISGGTGSGMFIQVALWLRKFLKGVDITIRGIFLLPDIYVKLTDIGGDKSKTERVYSNAYASIRELNAITKVLKGVTVKLPEKITIDDLFDSDRDNIAGKPLYDLAFFVDFEDANGLSLGSISAYEAMAAQLVYMQLYAPMKDGMYSDEDNLFIPYATSDEPLYGSCGVAKAEYPLQSVIEYCSIRAMQDSLTTGWGRIDSEIDTLIEEKRQRERDGIYTDEKIDVRHEYVELFKRYISVKPDDAGSDRFFPSIAKDVENEKKSKDYASGKTKDTRTDKINDFINELDKNLINVKLKSDGGLEDLTSSYSSQQREGFWASISDEDKTVDGFLNRANSEDAELADIIETFDKQVERYANDIVDKVCPYSMGDVNAKNACTVYGMLTKTNDVGEQVFIHPVAARCLLYRLLEKLQEVNGGLTPDDAKIDAEEFHGEEDLFDNRWTPSDIETTPQEYLRSKKFFQLVKPFLQDFAERYFGYMGKKVDKYRKYEEESLKQLVYRKLIGRVEELTVKFESFFRNFDDIQRNLNSMLDKNIRETGRASGRTTYVLGDKDSKESIYKSLVFKDTGDAAINKSVIHTIYGTFCAEKRPSNMHNAAYKDVSVTSSFIEQTLASFVRGIKEDPDNWKNVDLDIYDAICQEGGGRVGDEVFKEYVKSLKTSAALFISRADEVLVEKNDTGTDSESTFWGFNPVIIEKLGKLNENILGNVERNANEAYPKNELCCYRAAYGVKAENIYKFREDAESDCYYRYYKAVIDRVILKNSDPSKPESYLDTPHIDKRWHRILPFISAEKRKESEDAFYHAFWLAVAYGLVYADNSGHIRLKRVERNEYGAEASKDVPFTVGDKQISVSDVALLINTLKCDMRFVEFDIPALEEKYQSEPVRVNNYIDRKVIKGLMKVSGLNPIRLISRFSGSSSSDVSIILSLKTGIERIAQEVAAQNDIYREGGSLERSKFYICRLIYDSVTDVKNKESVFDSWVEKFAEFGHTGKGGEDKAADENPETDGEDAAGGEGGDTV